jgi:hypothetical protein
MNQEDGKNRKEQTNAKASRGAIGLRGSGDGKRLLNLSPASMLASRAREQRDLPSQLFAHSLQAKYLEPFRSGVLDFLSEYFGERFSSRETTKLAGEKFYRKTVKTARRSTARTRLDFALSLNFQQSMHATYLNLNESSMTRLIATLHRELLRRETLLVQAAPRSVSPVLPRGAARTSRESREVLTIHERVAREVFSKIKLETVRPQDVAPGRTAQFEPLALSSPPRYSRINITRHARTLLSPSRTAHAQTQSSVNAPEQASIMNVFVRQQSNLSQLSKNIMTRTRGKTEHHEQGGTWKSVPGPSPGRAFIFKFIRQERSEGRSPFVNQFIQPVTTRFLHSESLEFIRRALLLSPALEETQWSAAGDPGRLFQLLTLRPLMTLPEAAWRLGKGMTNVSDREQVFAEQRQSLERVLVALRHDTRLELPPVARVFTPPHRPVIEAQKAVKQVEEKEVIEIVKREVHTQMRSHSAVANFTRTDFNLISDHIYDVLARRLLMEQERRGLNS